MANQKEEKIIVMELTEKELSIEEAEKEKREFQNRVFTSKEIKKTGELLAELIRIFNKLDIKMRYMAFSGLIATLYSQINLPDALKEDAFNTKKFNITLMDGVAQEIAESFFKTKEKGEGKYIG
jgi:hypothetical protein